MFSLADQIQKFQKIILTMPDNVMTIDERFLGGGIKMQDLIQENSFIINEMRKFKGVFLNYCKLNDKIYKKIIQHQVNSDQHLNKMVSLSSSIDRKIQQSDQQIKKIKGDIFTQISKLKEYTQTNVNKIKEGWDKKIDEQTLAQKVIQIIQQYDNSNQTLNAPENNQGFDQNQLAQQSSIVKKRRGLTPQDIQAFKSEIMPLIDEVNQKVDKQELRTSQCINTLQLNNIKIRKLDCQTKWNSQDIANFKKQIQQMKIYVNTEDKKVIQIIRQTINENVWTQRFQNFNTSILVPSLQKMSIKLQNYIQILKKDIEQQVKLKIKENYMQIQKIKQKQKQMQSKTTKNQQRIASLGNRIQQVKQQLQAQIQQLDKGLQKLIHEHSVQQKRYIQKVNKQTTLITKKLDEVSNVIQQEVLKKVQIKLGKDMRQIRGEIHTINHKISQINNNIKFNKQQVNHVKDVVAKKANYTDLIMYFDKKADKEQFKQLQQLFAESPNHSNFGTINQGLCQRRQTQDLRRKRSTLSKRNTAPLFTKPQQQPGKYLLIGCQSPQKSREFVKSMVKYSISSGPGKNKNKSIRPSTANTLFKI